MCAAHEDALVAVNRAKRTRVPTFKTLEPTKPWMSFVELSIERSANYVLRIKRGNGCDVVAREFSIHVVKKHPLSRRRSRTAIELSSTIWFLILDKRGTQRRDTLG